MNWDKASAVRMLLTLAAISLSAGCGVHMYDTHHYGDYEDLSTSASREVATISGASTSSLETTTTSPKQSLTM